MHVMAQIMDIMNEHYYEGIKINWYLIKFVFILVLKSIIKDIMECFKIELCLSIMSIMPADYRVLDNVS